MTIAEYASELADHVRAEGADGPALRQALQLAVRMWLDIDRAGASELEWGLFATEVQTVADRLYPHPPQTAIILDPAAIADEGASNGAIRELIKTAANVLQTASREPGQTRAWEYAAAAVALHDAADHLP